jgi:uncharacterized membrane protein
MREPRFAGERTCGLCGRRVAANDAVVAEAVGEPILRLVRQDHPDWSGTGYICRADLARYRAGFVHSLLEAEKGELTHLEQQVLKSLQEHQLLSTDVDSAFDRARTRGELWADRIAAFGGSWTFLIAFGAFTALWIAMNSLVLFWRPVDPYPFILLNLLLSCLAAIQAPIIMMSQNRQEAKDRLRSQHDYQVNLKAELEIRHLHEKVDHVLYQQWERLIQIQELQLQVLTEIGRPDREAPSP